MLMNIKKRKLKKTVLGIVGFVIIGMVAMVSINAIINATKFMYIPQFYSNGDNAYNKGWSSTSTDKPDLSFVYYGECGCYRALKIEVDDKSKTYNAMFKFEFSYYVRTEFSIVLENVDSSDLVLRATILQNNDPIAIIPLTTFDFEQEYYLTVNNTRLEFGLNHVEISSQILPFGGMDGLKIEITGFSGIMYLVDLKGRRL